MKASLHNRDEDMIQICVDTFPTLTHFCLKSFVYSPINSKENSILNSLEFISNLKNLKHLDFRNIQQNNKEFCDSMKRMANKCQKLKSIKWQFNITPEFSDVCQLLSPFKAFPSLQRLNLLFRFDDFEEEEEEDIEISEMFSFEAFRGLSNITHLTLRFDDHWDEFGYFANILTNIDIYLPKLQYFELKNEIKANPEEVTQMADILSRLSRLQTLKLIFSEGIDYNEIEVKIREKCRKIRTIHINQYNCE